MKTGRRLTTILAALLFLVLVLASAWAQDDSQGVPYPDNGQNLPNDQAQPQATPDDSGNPTGPPPAAGATQNTDPSGRVARIEYMQGEVSMQPGGVNDWVAATQNRPLTTADRIWTDKNSKAELATGDGFLRMNSETSVTLSNVSDNTVQVELDQGTLELTVLHLENGQVYEVDTPNAAFTVMKTGVYRFDVYPNDDQTSITVRKGYGEATGKGSAVRINSGEQVRFSNEMSLVHTSESAPTSDGFDDWAKVRDERMQHSESARYVSQGVIGSQDLDANGHWVNTPQYGPVWVPNSVPVGWAPYRYGHWAWINPWGWTWVDDASWGFAPFHYGRWVSYNGYWGWAPPPLGYYRPYYAPALVGWIGGPGFGVGFGGGGFGVSVNFGWFALSFGEPFYPWYGGWGWGHGGWYRAGYGGYCSAGYFRAVNVTNIHVTNITNFSNSYYTNNLRNVNYANRNINGAVTAAPRSAFTSGAQINRVGTVVPRSGLQNAHMVRAANVTPTRQSVLGGNAPATRGVPPSSAFNRSVVTRNTPPARPSGFGGGAATQANAGRNGGAPNNNGSFGAAHAPTGNNGTLNASHNPNTGTTTMARGNGEANGNGHYVPRPPSAGGTPDGVNSQANANAARNNTNSAGMGNNSAYQHNGNPNTQSEAAMHNVPRPPANYNYHQAQNQGYQSRGTSNAEGTSSQRAGQPNVNAQASHQQQNVPPAHGSGQAAPSERPSNSSGHSGSGSKDGNNGHDGSRSQASNSVPRPPANYSYHGNPTYTASNGYGNNRMGSSYGNSGSYGNSSAYGRGSSYSQPTNGYRSPSSQAASMYRGPSSQPSSMNRSPYGGSPSYGSSAYGNRGSYSAPSYGANRSYSPAPATRSYSSAPSYSGRSGGSGYSAPRSYGSSGGHSSGGGSSHSSGGGHSGSGHGSR